MSTPSDFSGSGLDRSERSPIGPSRAPVATPGEDQKRLARWYSQIYGDRSPLGYFFRTRAAHVIRMLGRSRGGRLLDIGCAAGTVLQSIARQRPGAFDLCGVDVAAAMVEEGRRISSAAGEAVYWVVGRIERLPFPDATFDVVLALGVLESVPMGLAMAEVARVARPGALVICSMLNKASPYRVWQRLSGRWRGRGRLYTVRSFRNLLRANRLGPEETVHYDFNLFLSPLDERYPRASMLLNRALGFLARSPLRWLATGFVVAARRE